MNHVNSKLLAIYSFMLIASCVMMNACKEGPTSSSEEHLIIEISKSSGDDFYYGQVDERRFYAPYPFNVGYIETNGAQKEIMLISKQVDKGDKVDILPIAKMSIHEKNGLTNDIYIAVPKDDDLAIISQMGFSEFTVEQFSLKQIVEYWYSNRYGLQGTSIKGWAPSDLDDFK